MRRWIVPALAVLLVPAISNAKFGPFGRDLVAHYSFNGTTGAYALDAAGSRLHARLAGNATRINSDGFGHSLALDGNQDYAVVDTFGAFDSDFYSYSLWIKPTSFATTQAVLSNHRSCCESPGQGGYGLLVQQGTGKLIAQTWLKNGQRLFSATSDAALQANVWSHVAVSFDGAVVRIWINGVVVNASAIGGTDTLQPAARKMHIGVQAYAAPQLNNFAGELDELRFYRRPFEAGEVAKLHSGAGGQPGAIFYESFDSLTEAVTENGYAPESSGASFVANGFRAGGLYVPGASGPSFPFAGNLDLDRGAISFWFKPNWTSTTLDFRNLLVLPSLCDSNGRGIRVVAEGHAVTLEFQDGGQSSQVTTLNVPLDYFHRWRSGKWHFVEVMWDSTEVGNSGRGRLVAAMDGAILAQKLFDFSSTGNLPARIHLGRSDSPVCGSNNLPVDGVYDELTIYNELPLDLDDIVAEYLRRSRDDGRVQPHETRDNSPDWAAVNSSLGYSTFYQTGQYQPVLTGHVPNNGEPTQQPFVYRAARDEREALFFNYYSHEDHGTLTAHLVGGRLSNGSRVLTDVELRTVRNWFQVAPANKFGSRLTPSYLPELLLQDATVDLDSPWRSVQVDWSGNLVSQLPLTKLPNPAETRFSLSADTSVTFVLNVAVPANAQGTYSGRVEIRKGTAVVDTLDIELRTHDFVLEKPRKEMLIDHAAMYDTFSCDRGNSGTQHARDCRGLLAPSMFGEGLAPYDRYLAELEDIGEHGFNGIFNKNDVRNSDEADQLVDDIIERAFGGRAKRIVFGDEFPAKPHSRYSAPAYAAMMMAFFSGRLDRQATFTTRDEPGYNNNLTAHLKDVRTHNEFWWGLGADSSAFVYYDTEQCLRDMGTEAAPGDGCEPEAVRERLGQIYNRSTPNPPYCWGAICEPPGYPQLDHVIYNVEDFDELSAAPAFFENLLRRDLRHGGYSPGNLLLPSQRELIYWQAELEDPRVNRYYAGNFLFLTDLDGIAPFNYYQALVETNPFDDFDMKDGFVLGESNFKREKMLVYPGADGPVGTIQWEAMREGIDDYRYLQTWQTLHDAVERWSPADAAGARASVASALEKYRTSMDAVLADVSVADFEADRATVVGSINVLLARLADDDDGDGVANGADNCPLNANPGQADANDNGTGDACEAGPLQTLVIESEGPYDGFVREHSVFEGIGQTVDAAQSGAYAIRLGDHDNGTQLLGILSFPLGALPAGVSIESVSLEMTDGGATAAGDVSSLGPLRVDVADDYFGDAATLAPHDFEALAEFPNSGVLVRTGSSGPYGLWSADLANSAYPALTGGNARVQLRLRFQVDDDNDGSRDWITMFSGEHSAVTARRPRLVIRYR